MHRHEQSSNKVPSWIRELAGDGLARDRHPADHRNDEK